MPANVTFSVFTKPWKTMPLSQLGEMVKGLGFDGIEFPVRPGYQVEPDSVHELPRAAEQLAQCGVQICSVAGPTDEATIAACAEARVPTIRICPSVHKEEGYLAAEQRLQKEYDALVPLLDQYGVQLGIQNHCGNSVPHALGLRRLFERYDPGHVAAVWDAAHNALQGEEVEFGIDIVWSHLCMVNLKNAYWQRTNGPEAEVAEWRVYWTSGRHGLASWPRVVNELKARNYEGVICLTAEYSVQDAVDRLIAEDIAFARSLFD